MPLFVVCCLLSMLTVVICSVVFLGVRCGLLFVDRVFVMRCSCFVLLCLEVVVCLCVGCCLASVFIYLFCVWCCLLSVRCLYVVFVGCWLLIVGL